MQMSIYIVYISNYIVFLPPNSQTAYLWTSDLSCLGGILLYNCISFVKKNIRWWKRYVSSKSFVLTDYINPGRKITAKLTGDVER